MAALPRPARKLAFVLAIAVTIPILATLAFAAIGHPECATIPQDVGPCGYWSRVAEYGPFIMLWGTIATVGVVASMWPFVVALRPRRE
ncbi:hypothetical protein ACFWU5_07845 [Nocardia sp. NPDC058640]|uniref:hypothetical protein n=1 Tax=Nocardia sp. NPDC058640 TaxID=3346571 RepID=UPI00366667BB